MCHLNNAAIRRREAQIPRKEGPDKISSSEPSWDRLRSTAPLIEFIAARQDHHPRPHTRYDAVDYIWRERTHPVWR
jgi:hypothetical protein